MINVGIIGFGVVGKRRKKYISENKFYNLRCISDISFNQDYKTKNIDFYKSYKKFIKHDLDAVFITLPNYLAVKVTSFFLKKNIHVFCEKPPAKNYDELKSLKKILEKNKNLKLKYGFNHRYHGSVKKAENLIDSKIYGKIINFRAIYGKSKIVTFGKNEWRANRKFSGGGILIDQGIHLLDLITKFGGKFEKFKSFISNSYWKYDVEDNAFAIMKNTKKNIIASIHSTATQWEHKFSLEITLEKALIILSGILSGTKSYGKEKIIVIPKPINNKNVKKKIYQFYKDFSWKLEIDEFAKIIINNSKVKTGSYQDALNVMKMIDKIYTSDTKWYKSLKK
jgi:predicted dehydrogenase